MDLTTNYLGLNLRSPLVPSASPLSHDLDNIKRMEDAGAAAIVLYSLFEEQLSMERYELHHHLSYGVESFPEALSYFPEPATFHLGSEGYLKHIRHAKESVEIPIIASLNCTSVGQWLSYAQDIEEAGADALELNIYYIPTDTELFASDIENTYIEIVEDVKSVLSIPIAIKLSPFFSSFANFAKRLDKAGANGLVLFNRFYQPDIDLEHLEVKTNLILSSAQDLRLPMRWIAILHGQLKADLAATSGIHTAEDILKMLMVGAKITMLCSTLLKHGINYIKILERDLIEWMTSHEYESVKQMQGSMSQKHCADPTAFERAHYIQTIQNFPRH